MVMSSKVRFTEVYEAQVSKQLSRMAMISNA